MNAAVFHQAVSDGDATRVKFLINIGQQARVNQRNKHGYTSLQQSCKDGRYELADVLLSHGANITATDKKGRTALHFASAGGYLDIVKLLIASCANINAKDNQGNLAIDVAKNDEITALLAKAAEEKEANNPESTKKGIPEDWSQNVTSLPAGSRNSLVSNSSSDSGVFTEENSSTRNGDNSKLTRPNGYTSSRSSTGDTRIMGVLNESDENLFEGGRERARTVHEIGTPIDKESENIYEQSRERSNTFENHIIATKLNDREEYEHGNNLSDRTSQERSHLNAANPYKKNQHESHLIAQTTMKMPHNTNPQPKLRRSMSERLPARQRKCLNGLRDISEELSALNLSRKIAREAQNGYYYGDTYRQDFRSQNLPTIPEPHSPNEDLGYGGEGFEVLNEFDESGRSSMRKYYANDSRTLPRNQGRQMEFYPPRDEVWEEGFREEFTCGVPLFRENRYNVSDACEVEFYNDVEHYRRKQPRNSRGLRRQTIETCPMSNIEDGYRATGDRSHAYLSNEVVENLSQRERPRSRMSPQINMFDTRDFEETLINTSASLRRSSSACSDTAIGCCHRRMMQNRAGYIDFNANQDYHFYDRDYSRGLPSYEETLQRLSSESRRPASRQVSQV